MRALVRWSMDAEGRRGGQQRQVFRRLVVIVARLVRHQFALCQLLFEGRCATIASLATRSDGCIRCVASGAASGGRFMHEEVACAGLAAVWMKLFVCRSL